MKTSYPFLLNNSSTRIMKNKLKDKVNKIQNAMERSIFNYELEDKVENN